MSTYTNDILGRTIKRTTPGGVSSYTIRTLREARERPGLPYYTVLSLPHQLAAASSGQPFNGNRPATVTIYNASGRSIQSSGYELDGAADYDPVNSVYSLKFTNGLAVELARSTVQHNTAGLTVSTRRWHAIDPADATLGRYQDSFTYDTLGRLEFSTNANGTITKYAGYDILDRVHEVSVGTSSTNLKKVAAHFYDSGGTTTETAGNGNLTLVQSFFDTSDSISRDTVRTFDFRDRLVFVEPPEKPYELLAYDNLDRVIQRGVYSDVPTTIPDPGDPLPTSDRGLYSKTSYSQRGLRYRQQVAINPTNDADGFLESHAWFDAAGRTVCDWMPNSAATKRVYDGHGRPTTVYVTDRGSDAAPGSADTLEDAISVTDDIVLEQVGYAYNTDDRVQLVTSWRRWHDDASPSTGALSSTNAVASYVGYVYDAADRQIRTVNFGTNDAAASDAPTGTFRNGTAPGSGTTPPWPPASGVIPGWGPSDAYANQIVTGTTYNIRGLVEKSIDPYPGDPTGSGDPKSRETKVLYDDLSRRIAVIENYENAVVKWNDSATPPRWKVDSGLDDARMDQDRVTSFVYDGSGNVVQQGAHTPTSSDTEQVQVTQYVYGITAASSPGTTDSLVNSNDILKEVRYPNESTGEPGTSTDNTLKVRYAYNRRGELRSVIDQNTTTHLYARDDVGRVKRDDVETLGGTTDGTVRAIEVGFDDFGRLDTVKSRSTTGGSGGTILNAVKFTYTDLWQIATVEQDADSDLGASSQVPGRTVTYHYDTEPVATGNYSRLQDLEYPDLTQVASNYAGGCNSIISRTSELALSIGKLALYSFVGHSMVAAVDYEMADVQLDRTMSPDGKRNFSSHTSQSAGVYPGWDRFGRVRYHAWVDGNLDHNSTTNLPNRPQIVAEAYTYDHASNRLTKFDDRSGLPWASQDNQYTYDGLDRLIEARRGKWTGSALTTAGGLAGSSQKWDLDMLGNWSKFVRDLSGNGTYADSTDLIDDRAHNQANEIGTSTTRHDGD